jgi:hypothetical protein
VCEINVAKTLVMHKAWAMDVSKPHKSIGFADIHGPKRLDVTGAFSKQLTTRRDARLQSRTKCRRHLTSTLYDYDPAFHTGTGRRGKANKNAPKMNQT